MPLAVTYATYADVVTNALPYIASGTNVSSAFVAAYIGRNQAKVDGALARRYTVPFGANSVPPLVNVITTELACYDLVAKSELASQGAPDSPWPDRWKEAMDLLEQLANGDMLLVMSGGGVIPQTTTQAATWSSTSAYQPTFSELDPALSVVDPNKLTDESDARNF